jgi:hypothetical protein
MGSQDHFGWDVKTRKQVIYPSHSREEEIDIEYEYETPFLYLFMLWKKFHHGPMLKQRAY